ncbi:ABC transporter type 1, transmembrane domain-containing protein [Mycena vitilis]|nr:ABC transporter type 1, transmembrane domain-containing protein [Mycena vitilis]
MRYEANMLGYSLNQKGLFAGVVRDPRNRTVKTNTDIGNIVASETEEEIFYMLGVPFQQPHERWPSPFLNVGFSRTLEKEDLWELPKSRLTSNTTDALEANFYPRCPPAVRPSIYRPEPTDTDTEIMMASAESTEAAVRPYSSLFAAPHRTFYWRIWFGGILKLFADTLKTTTPLLTKVLLTWLTESYIVYHATDVQKASGLLPKPQGIGYGIGLGVGLFAMQEVSSLMTNHSQQIMETVGLRVRLEHTVGQTTTIISSNSVRLDRFSMFAHNIWVAPIQIVIGIGLLINNLGYSALVGLGVLLLGFPLQIILVKIMFTQRKKGVKITDTRVRLTNEVLQGIRLIKYYAWEAFYTHQIGDLREREIATVRKMAIARAALIALVTLIPVLASVLSFITYALSGRDLNIATVIFSSLQFFKDNSIWHPPVRLCSGAVISG